MNSNDRQVDEQLGAAFARVVHETQLSIDRAAADGDDGYDEDSMLRMDYRLPENFGAFEWAKKIIEGSGGMNAFQRFEWVIWHHHERVHAAHWAIKCLANPKCEGSGRTLDAIIRRRHEQDGDSPEVARLRAENERLRGEIDCACNALTDSIQVSGNDARTNLAYVRKLRAALHPTDTEAG